MPFKSKAQRRKFAELLVKGEISPEDVRRVESVYGETRASGARKEGQKTEEARSKGNQPLHGSPTS